MLNQRIDIVTIQPPLLMTIPNASWHLIVKIERTSGQCVIDCIKEENGQIDTYQQTLSEEPFHVAENIWELSYGVEIMTLKHSSLSGHPANLLWQKWKNSALNI